jgi:hypothetical protein
MHMKWLHTGLMLAVLLGLLSLALPAHTKAQANAETVTIPIGGMT